MGVHAAFLKSVANDIVPISWILACMCACGNVGSCVCVWEGGGGDWDVRHVLHNSGI